MSRLSPPALVAALLSAWLVSPWLAAPARADDASGLNSRVCNNISLTTREREACKHEMETAHSDEDRAKVRKEYEDKIVAARAKKSGGG